MMGWVVRIYGAVVRLVILLLVIVVLYTGVSIFKELTKPHKIPSPELKEIKITGKDIKVDVNKFRVERNSRGDISFPSVGGKIIAGRTINEGEEIPVDIDLRGMSTKARDSGYRFNAGLDSSGYYNLIGRNILQLWIFDLDLGVGYGFKNNSVLGVGSVGVPLFSEHWNLLVGYTTNQSFTIGLAFRL